MDGITSAHQPNVRLFVPACQLCFPTPARRLYFFSHSGISQNLHVAGLLKHKDLNLSAPESPAYFNYQPILVLGTQASMRILSEETALGGVE